MNGVLATIGGGRLGAKVTSGTVPGWGEVQAAPRGYGGVMPPGAHGWRGGPGGMPGGGAEFGTSRGLERGFDGPGMMYGPMGAFAHFIGAFIFIAIIALLVVAFWKLFQRAGFQGPWGLLAIVPLVNVAALVWLAFAEWPALSRATPAEGAAATAPEPEPSEASAPPV